MIARYITIATFDGSLHGRNFMIEIKVKKTHKKRYLMRQDNTI